VRPVLQDELTERRGCWPDEGGVSADTADGPVGLTAMTGRHMIGERGALSVGARPHVHCDPFAPGEDLDGTPGEANLDLAAREVVGNADASHAPFGEDLRLDRQGLQRRPVEFFEQPPARDAKAADRSLIVEPLEQLADRGVQLGQAGLSFATAKGARPESASRGTCHPGRDHPGMSRNGGRDHLGTVGGFLPE
jgi:hypothetical protein